MNVCTDIDYTCKRALGQVQSSDFEVRESQEQSQKQTTVSVETGKKGQKRKGTKSYHWSQVEQKKYLNFLVEHQKVFRDSTTSRRLTGVHQKMAKIVTSRDAGQCRSHHQKMMNKFGGFVEIVEEFRDLLYPRNMKTWQQQVTGEVKEERKEEVLVTEDVKSMDNLPLEDGSEMRWVPSFVSLKEIDLFQDEWSQGGCLLLNEYF